MTERMKMKRGFTLMEVLLAVVIIAILSGLLLPRFLKTSERSEARRAISHLHAIRVAELMNHSKLDAYAACADTAAIFANLGIDVGNTPYSFSVALAGGGFEARAKKGGAVAGSCADAETICIDQDGIISGTSAYLG